MKRLQPMKMAERRIVRAAVAVVNKEGWAFREQGEGKCPVVCFPDAMRRLETAIWRLKNLKKLQRAYKCKEPGCYRYTHGGRCFQHRVKGRK